MHPSTLAKVVAEAQAQAPGFAPLVLGFAPGSGGPGGPIVRGFAPGGPGVPGFAKSGILHGVRGPGFHHLRNPSGPRVSPSPGSGPPGFAITVASHAVDTRLSYLTL